MLAASLMACATAGADSGSTDEATAAVDEFFDRYLQPSGRIARTDQGGDTVSEGQAYGMLMAAAIGDRENFQRMWTWTDQHLQRGDRLLAWRWANGGIVDWSSAADADLIAAHALVLAGERFGDPALTAEGRRISAAALAQETVVLGGDRVLVAGPWARSEHVVNPSYAVIPSMSRLWYSGQREWGDVAAAARETIDVLTVAAPQLPPDWAIAGTHAGDVTPAAAPDGSSPRYGYEAARVLVQLAVDCNQFGRQLAARAWPFLASEAEDTVEATYALDGSPLVGSTHPLALVAAAGSAAAAGDHGAAGDLIDRASDADERHPSYYGAAWVALARLWLETDLMGGCRTG